MGSGSAGLTTAVVGASEGLETLVVEKTESYGGTTALSGGVAWVPNNASIHASIHTHFNKDRHLERRKIFIANRSAALAEWRQLTP